MNQDFLIRELHKDDISYIYASWLRHYKYSSRFAERITATIFFTYHHEIINRILARKTTKVLVAHPKDDKDVVLGYLVCEPDERSSIIHFIYVKRHFRKFGIAKELTKGLNLETAIFTHWTRDVDWISKRIPEMRYNPYSV